MTGPFINAGRYKCAGYMPEIMASQGVKSRISSRGWLSLLLRRRRVNAVLGKSKKKVADFRHSCTMRIGWGICGKKQRNEKTGKA
jgi:hypothetical protein